MPLMYISASLHELMMEYKDIEKEKNKMFDGKVGDDGSLQIPSISDIEQRVKQFVNNASHSFHTPFHILEFSAFFLRETETVMVCSKVFIIFILLR